MERTRLGLAALVLVLVAGLLTGCDRGPTVLSGTLTLPGGGPAPAGVAVTAFAGDVETAVATVVTGTQGAFRFGEDDLPPGDYRLRFGDGSWWQDADGWDTAEVVAASTTAPPTVDATVDAPSGAVIGTVRRRSGRPVAGASVRLVDPRTESTVATTTTAADGTWAFAGLSTRQVFVEVKAPTYTSWYSGDATTAAGADPVEVDGAGPALDFPVTLTPAATLTGSIGGVGADRSGFAVIVFERPSLAPVRFTTTESDGAFSFADLPAGTYGVRVIDPSGRFHDRVVGAPGNDPATGTTFALAENRPRSVGAVTLVGAACPVPSKSAQLDGVNLAGANLANCDLTGASLLGANLSDADLNGATLSLAALHDANLAGADLRNSRLINTYFVRSDLSGTRLTGALAMNTDFADATLTGAQLGGLTLNGANLRNTQFGGTVPGSVRSTGLIGAPLGLPAGWSLTAGCLVGPGASLAFQNFAGVDLAGRDLTGTYLLGSDFTGASLAGANLTAADLRNTKVTGADLTGTNLHLTSLTGVASADLVGTPTVLPAGWALVDGALFGASAQVSGADIDGVDLSGTDLTRITATGLVGTPAALPTGWVLAHGTLVGPAAHLTGANIDGVDLSAADLTAVTTGGLTGTPVALPPGWVLHNGYLVGPGANLLDAVLPGLVAPGIDLAGVNLQRADLSGADLTGADLTRTHLSLANLAGADLSGADLSRASMRSADVTDTVLGTATIDLVTSGMLVGTPASLPAGRPIIAGHLMNPGVQLVGVDLSGLDLSGLDLAGAWLQNATLGGTDLSGTNLAGALLTGATLTGTALAGTDLSGATLDVAAASGLVGTPAALPPGWIVLGGALVPPNG